MQIRLVPKAQTCFRIGGTFATKRNEHVMNKKMIWKSVDYQYFARLNPAIGSTLAEPKKVSLTSEKMCSNFTYGKPRMAMSLPRQSRVVNLWRVIIDKIINI